MDLGEVEGVVAHEPQDAGLEEIAPQVQEHPPLPAGALQREAEEDSGRRGMEGGREELREGRHV